MLEKRRQYPGSDSHADLACFVSFQCPGAITAGGVSIQFLSIAIEIPGRYSVRTEIVGSGEVDKS